MHILLCSTDKTNVDLAQLANIVNSLQYFFVVWTYDHRITFGDELQRTLVIEPQDLIQQCETALAGTTPIKRDVTIILTSASVAVEHDTSLAILADKAVISNHDWGDDEAATLLRFARKIIQIGFSRFVRHDSAISSCVAANGPRFDCLCFACERALKLSGFRDGIARLKDGFNILNQLGAGGGTELLPPPSELLRARLRLASTYANELKTCSPLAQIKVLVVLHFLSDLVPFVSALTELGATPENIFLVAKPYPYSRRDEVTHALQALGVNVCRATSERTVEDCVQDVLKELVVSRTEVETKILIIEDGGYFAPAMHAPEFQPLAARCLGAVEQTQKGAEADKLIYPCVFPILSVAESSFKKVYESPEIGRIVVQNISRFTPDIKLSAGHALVVGFGSVGREVAFHLTNGFNMTVSVLETDDLRLLEARHRKTVVAEAANSFDKLEFRRPNLVVGTTGKQSIGRAVLQGLEGDTVLVSTSSDQVEIDLAALTEMAGGKSVEVEEGKRLFKVPGPRFAKMITLLAEGYPINFYGSESVPNDTIDPVLTLLLLCAVELATNGRARNGVQTDIVKTVTEERDLVRRFLELS
jgi:S-adenosylhomocysteine hydrolase